jgi:MFS transporter, DHA3 family, macrolide efflux protein
MAKTVQEAEQMPGHMELKEDPGSRREFPLKRWQVPFFSIWTMQAFSLLGSQLVQFALIWYLTAETGSATVLAVASLVGLGPQVLLGPVIGALVDRWNRRLVMMAADGLVASATLILAGLFAFGQVEIWHIYALMFARSLAGAFHWPAMSASTSLMVPQEQLARIQGLNQLLQGALSIVAAPLGALLIAVLPMQGVLAIDVVTAVMAITPLLFIAVPQPRKTIPANDQTAKSSVWDDLKAGLRYTLSWPGLLILMGSATLVNLVLSTAFTLMPILITRHFNGGALQLGWIESLFGVGMLAGGLLLSVWGGFKRRIDTSLAGLLLLGVVATLLGLTPPNLFGLALGLALLIGISMPLVNGPVQAVMQAVVAPDMQGRIFTLLQSAAMGMMPLGLLIAGPVADRFGVQVWFILGGVITFLVGMVGFLSPALRSIESRAPQTDPGDPGLVLAPVPIKVETSLRIDES